MVDDVQPQPKTLEESKSALEADLEFELPADIPADAERIPESEIED